MILPGNANLGGRLLIIDLVIKIACCVKRISNIFTIKRNWSELVSTKRSRVPSLPLQHDFPDLTLKSYLHRRSIVKETSATVAVLLILAPCGLPKLLETIIFLFESPEEMS